MSRMRKVLAGVGIVAVIGVGFVTLSAFGGHGGWRGRMTEERAQQLATYFLDDALDELEATDEQRKVLHDLKDRRVKEVFAFSQEHKALRGELLGQWDAANPDPKALHALVDARIEALRTLAHAVADDALAVHGTLTPGQRAEVSEHVKSRGGGCH